MLTKLVASRVKMPVRGRNEMWCNVCWRQVFFPALAEFGMVTVWSSRGSMLWATDPDFRMIHSCVVNPTVHDARTVAVWERLGRFADATPPPSPPPP